MIERSLQLDTAGTTSNGSRCATRPTDLPTENRRWTRHGKPITVGLFKYQCNYLFTLEYDLC